MERATLVLFLLAAMFYVGASVLYVYYFASRNNKVSIAATAATGIGFALQTAVLVLRWVQQGRPPIQGPFNTATMIAWWVILVYFLVEYLTKVKTLGIVVVPVAVLLMAWGGVNYQPPTREIEKILQSTQVVLHLAMVFTAYAAFTLAAGAAVLYLIQERQLKKKKIGGPIFKRLPSLDVLENVESKAVLVGVPFITIGLVLGIIRAIQFIPNWYLEPLVLLAIFMWAYYVAYLLLSRYGGWAGRRSAWMAVLGLALISALRVLATVSESAIFHRYGG